MTQESRLVIVIDSKNAEKNTAALREELTKIFNEGNKASDSTGQFGASAKSAGNSAQGMATGVNSSTKALDNQEKSANKNITAIKEMAKVIAGFIAIDKGIAMADGYTQMAARIRNATTSAAEYNLVQDRLLATANTTFRALSEAQEVYLSMAGGMKSLGRSTKDTLDLSDSLSFAFTANATRADQAQSAMDSLSKSMAKGKIDADAWISIVTGADNIIADMAKVTGKTEGEIRKLGASGKASLDDLIKTLIATLSQNEALANSMENSAKDGFTNLTTAVTVFLGKLNMATGTTGTFAAGLGVLGENVDKIAILGGIAASIYAGRLAQAFVISAQKAAWNTVAMVTQAGAMTTATTAARGLYMALGGPVGLAVGVAGVAASYLLFNDSTKSTTSTLNAQIASVDELVKKYSELDALQRKTYMRELEVELKSLTSTYTATYAELSAYTEWLENSGSVSESTARKMSDLLNQYSRGQIDAATFSTEVGNLTGVQQKHKDKIDDLTTAQSKSKVEYERVKAAQAALTNQTQSAIDANNGETKSINEKTAAQEKYLESLKVESDQSNQKNELWMRNVKAAGGNKYATEWANFIESWKDKNKLPLDKALDEGQLKIAQKEFLVAQDRAKLQDKITASTQAQTKELKEQNKISKGLGNGMVSNSHLKGLPIKSGESTSGGKVRGYTAEFAQILGKELKSSIGAFTGFNDKYHQGKGGKHPQGQAFDLRLNNGANSANVDAQIKALADKYGYVVKTLDEYKNPSKNATGGHMHVSVTGRKGGSSSASDYLKQQKADIKDQKDAEREAEQAAKNRVQLKMNVADQVTKIKMKLAEDLKEVDKAGFSDDQAKALKAKYQAQADSEIELAKFALKTKIDDFSDFQKTEMQMLEKSYAQKKVYAMQDLELNANERKEAVALLDKQLKQEQAMLEVAKVQREYARSLEFNSQLKSIQDRIALAQAPAADRSRLTLNQDQSNAYAQNDQQLLNDSAAIDQQRIEIGEQEHFKRLEDAKRLHKENEYAISLEYKQKEQDLVESQRQSQLQLWGSLLSQGQNTWSQLTQSIKDGAGEGSAAFKIAFAAQQAFSIGSALVSTHLAAAQAAADPTQPTVIGKMTASQAIMAMGYANVGLIAAQTIAGFATGGYVRGAGTGTSDSIPAFLSDKEFVVKASAVQSIGVDNLNAMNQTGQLPQVQRERRQAQAISTASSGDVINAPITVQVNVQSDGSSSVDTQGQAKQLGDMIGNAVRTVIRQEQRQGGLLSK